MKKKIAVCIPTYKRPRVVEDFLNTCSAYYLDSGIDIYYYDSSPDNYTEEIIKQYNRENIFYIRVPQEMPSNIKVYQIYKGYGLKKKYDFIWVCGDAIQYAKTAIDNLLKHLDMKYDIIQMDSRDYGGIGNKEYTDYNIYLRDCAWELTLYGSAILNCHTMFDGVDWKYYKDIYNKKNLINFSHVIFYFTRICKLDTFRAYHISVDNKYFKSSYYKRKSGWYNDAFFILCESWVDAIESLPECYIYKEEAIMKHGQYVMLKNAEDIAILKEPGIYNYKIYKKYQDRLRKVCPVNNKILKRLAILPMWVINIYFGKKSKKYMINKLCKFCKNKEHIYIYGAGQYGHAYAIFLTEMGINYKGYVVTNVTDNPSEFVNDNIYNITDVKCTDKDGIIVAVSSKYSLQVITILKNMNIKNVFYEKDLYREVVG